MRTLNSQQLGPDPKFILDRQAIRDEQWVQMKRRKKNYWR